MKPLASALSEIWHRTRSPLQVFFGSEGLRRTQQAYAERLKTWAGWEELSAAAH